MSNIEPTTFGDKYVLVEHIATGGMAEIYRAQYAGIEGFAKELVVKMLRAEFAVRRDVVGMFLDEARAAATLTHNNVVHTYDLGEIDGDFFIAMELLKGQELVNVMRRSHHGGRPLPRELAIGITMQSCEGLHYVHTRVDERGQDLGLVHRDINPTNVHVGYDGVCKILDFGIAATRASAVAKKGQVAVKISYMAPEQLQGLPLDHRADIFPLGVMLYEMCLGRRLFRGPRGEVTARVLAGDVPPPTFVDPRFPPGLEAIIMKALEVDPGERYQNCDHMFRDLERVLQELGGSASPRKLSALMVELFGEGAPARVDYHDDYDDPIEGSLDFAAFEGVGETLPDEASPPAWAPAVSTENDDRSAKRRRRLTIGNLEALIAQGQPEPPVGPPNRAGRHRRVGFAEQSEEREFGGESPRGPAPKRGARTRSSRFRGVGDASRSQPTPASGRHNILGTGPLGIVEHDPDGGRTFGHAVVSERSKTGAIAWSWILGLVAVCGLGYFLFNLLTSK